MKIAFFIPTMELGGVQRVFINLSSLLQANGYSVDFVLCRSEGLLTEQLSSEINLISFGKNKKLRHSFFDLTKYIRKEQPRYLITGSDIHNLFVITCNIFCGGKTKVIATQHNFNDADIKDKRLYHLFYKLLIKRLYPKAYKVISVSHTLHNYISELSPKSDALAIYNPFDLTEIISSSQKPNINFDLPSNYILYAGRLAKVKNLEILIKAFEKMHNLYPDYKLIIVGSGPESSNLYQLKGDNPNIIFSGEVDHCYYLIKHAKVIALSSVSETLPSILIEALILKKTIVSTPTPGAIEVLQNGKYGYISESLNDIQCYTKTLIEGINNPIDEESLFTRAKDFSHEKIFKKYSNILK